MSIVTITFFFIFGTLIGSFLNVVVYRLHSGLSIARGRSQCFSCARTLQWYELVPVISFLFLSARCRTCKAPISFQYVVLELATGLLFAALAFHTGFSLNSFSLSLVLELTLLFLVASFTLTLCVYDMRQRILPLSLNLALLFTTFFYALLQYMRGEWSVLDVSTGLLLALPIALLHFGSQGRWIGFGDIILFASTGFFLGFVAGVHAFVYAFWIGAAVSLILIKISKKYSLRSEIPFGPFIILALWISFFMQKDVFGISLLI
jgi:leader peptidase (prepilin peptidase) / N-methyltransferase